MAIDVDGGPGPDGMPMGMVHTFTPCWRGPDGRPFDAGEHTHYSGPATVPGPWPDRKLGELGEMFVTALTFLWLGTGALVYLVVGLLMVAFVVVAAPPLRLYMLARDAWRHRSKARPPSWVDLDGRDFV
jgi:hypothetical protein